MCAPAGVLGADFHFRRGVSCQSDQQNIGRNLSYFIVIYNLHQTKNETVGEDTQLVKRLRAPVVLV
jgi:hypothetical protein